jgi:hypothetical protein
VDEPSRSRRDAALPAPRCGVGANTVVGTGVGPLLGYAAVGLARAARRTPPATA